MVTMREVADLAGVSITTVSHVVNGTRSIRPDTEQRVREAIERTGYTGNAIARSLARGGTHTLGVALPLSGIPRLPELLGAVESAAAREGYSLLLVDTHDSGGKESEALRAVRSRQVDGVLLVASPDATETVLPELRRSGPPAVLLGRMPTSAGLDAVGPENVQATSSLVGHLAAAGHTRIGMIAGTTDLVTAAERVLGYRLGLGRAGLSWDPEIVSGGESPSAPPEDAVGRMLRLPQPVTAVIAGDGTLLGAVLGAARDAGAAVGTDLAVVGYGDVEWAELMDPPVTALAEPVAEEGSAAVAMLLDRMSHPEADPRATRLPPVLMHRRSCGCRGVS